MAPMTARKRPKQRRQPARVATPESRRADTLTIGWMLSVLTALGCEFGWALARMLAAWQPTSLHFEVLQRLLLFAATVVGLVSMGLAAVVTRMRREAVPASVVAFALIVAALPLVVIALLLAQ